MQRVACLFQNGHGGVETFAGYQQVIRVEGRKDEETDSRSGERAGECGKDADFGEHERAVNFDDAPAALMLDAGGNVGLLGNDGKFVSGPSYRKEGALRGPRGKLGVRRQADDGVFFREEREIQMAERRFHREKQLAPWIAARTCGPAACGNIFTPR